MIDKLVLGWSTSVVCLGVEAKRAGAAVVVRSGDSLIRLPQGKSRSSAFACHIVCARRRRVITWSVRSGKKRALSDTKRAVTRR